MFRLLVILFIIKLYAQTDIFKGGFISTIFTRQKKDGSFRTILNLKHLNHYVNYKDFKMESLNEFFIKLLKR